MVIFMWCIILLCIVENHALLENPETLSSYPLSKKYASYKDMVSLFQILPTLVSVFRIALSFFLVAFLHFTCGTSVDKDERRRYPPLTLLSSNLLFSLIWKIIFKNTRLDCKTRLKFRQVRH